MSQLSILIEKITSAFEGLTERERKLILGLAATVAILVVLGLGFVVLSSLSNKQKELETIRQQMAQMQQISGTYYEAKARQDELMSRLRAGGPSLFSVLQSAANRVGVQISDMNEQKSPGSDSGLLQTNVKLAIKQVSIDKLTSFLEYIEDQSGGVSKVVLLSVRTRFDAPDLLDVSLTVTSWKS